MKNGRNYNITEGGNLITIGIIVPNYNHGKFIAYCINSIICQDVSVDELIVVDDCSVDDSVELIKELVANVRYARVIRNTKNLGVYGAISAGVDLVNTDYVMFLASNDFLLPGCIGHAKKSLMKHRDVGLWSATGNMVDEAGMFIKPIPLAIPSVSESYFTPRQAAMLARQLGNWFAGPSVIYNKTIWESLGRFNPRYGGFSDLICALMVASLKGAIFVPISYVGMRVHKDSFHSNTLKDSESAIKVLKNIQDSTYAICPSLFQSAFTYLTIRRLVFTTIRANSGLNLKQYGVLLSERESGRLNYLDRILPDSFVAARVILSFLILRPMDILPSIKNRYLMLHFRRYFCKFVN